MAAGADPDGVQGSCFSPRLTQNFIFRIFEFKNIILFTICDVSILQDEWRSAASDLGLNCLLRHVCLNT